jgi:GT2 family glycosyltransferase
MAAVPAAAMIGDGDLFAVVVATRNRPAAVMRLLDALERQPERDFQVMIVDQSDPVDTGVEKRVNASGRLHLIRDEGMGTARARNLGWRNLGATWVSFLDDDTPPEPDWAASLREELVGHPYVDMVSGPVAAERADDDGFPALGGFAVEEPQLLAGRYVRPWRVAGGICTVRRATLERIGGWDERLGPGTAEFLACEDMDFNYRLTRSGGRVYLTPRVRVSHDQWRSSDEVLALYAAYNRAWGGVVSKHLKTGDPVGAARLAAGRLRGIWRVRRSRRLARAELGGFLRGTARGLRQSW